MTQYEYLLKKIKYILNRDNVENENGIMSFYDVIEHAKEEMKELKNITKSNSTLAKEINDYSFINKHLGKFYTKVKTETLFNPKDIKSTLIISSAFEDLVFTKNKNSNTINIYPGYEGKEKFLNIHMNSIIDTFSKLEKYSEILGDINDNLSCFTYDVNSMFYLRIYYNNYGYIKPEISLRSSFDSNVIYNRDNELQKLVDDNTYTLLKKIPFYLNQDLDKFDNNKILLLAKQGYLKDQEKKVKVYK